jgi:hypothetical protein
MATRAKNRGKKLKNISLNYQNGTKLSYGQLNKIRHQNYK